MGNEVREYEWQLRRRRTIVLAVIFFALLAYSAAFGTDKSSCGSSLLCAYVFYKFGEDGLLILSYFFVILSLGIAVNLAYSRLSFKQRLVFRSEALVVPVSRWSHKEMEIAYRDIVEISQFEISNYRFFIIKHKGGRLTISEAWLPSRAVFNEVSELLDARVQEAKRMKLL